MSQNIFNQITEQWFTDTFGTPTLVQQDAWPAIASGKHTLISAPTGTGKTLAAFLGFIDKLKQQARNGTLKPELSLIYISPLKSLAADIRENLRRPLDGITKYEHTLGLNANISVAVRTGDTTQKERRNMIKNPPHILITTPESLFLLLTSKTGRNILKTAQSVIIDELHAIIDSKRGAHLLLSIARLDKLCQTPLQRIGLSATIQPAELAASWLSPDNPIVAAPAMHKEIRLSVVSPLMENQVPNGSIWPDIARAVYESCIGTTTVIAFVEGRMHAEKLAYYVNKIAGGGFARTHHGSISKERRLEAETALRNGELRLLCATSSMELGIDVGDIDLVVQIGNPRSISGTLQRLGRSGHNPGKVSQMTIFPREASEALYCGLTAKTAANGNIEHARPPRKCLDVLAAHLVSMATDEGYSVDDALSICTRAFPFYDITKQDIIDILSMLAGDYEHKSDIPIRPRVLFDRIAEYVTGDAYSRMLALSSAGTIPDKGMYPVKSETGVKLGELEEEFVFEARVGDKFLLGSFAWKIISMDKNEVIVTQASAEGAQPPFWKGDRSGLGIKTALAFGEIFRQLQDNYPDTLTQALKNLGLDNRSTQDAAAYINAQIEAAGILPNDRTIIVEHFSDDAGDSQIMVHSMFGMRVNAPFSLLVREIINRKHNLHTETFGGEFGFMLYPYSSAQLPQNILSSIDPNSARKILTAILPATPLFAMAFRYNAARALMMGVRKASRSPLWIQRLRGAELLDRVINQDDHPLIRETKRECLDDYWDLPGLEYVLQGIQTGEIAVREIYSQTPSPMTLPLRRRAESILLYEYSPTTNKVIKSIESAVSQLELTAPASEVLNAISERTKTPNNPQELHTLLMIEGDLTALDIKLPNEWFSDLASQNRALYIEPGLWIAAEHLHNYQKALQELDLNELCSIARRALRYRGAFTALDLEERYFLPGGLSEKILTKLTTAHEATLHNGLYYHTALFDRARKETIKHRRSQIKTQPPEHYAALMAAKTIQQAPQDEQAEQALNTLDGKEFPTEMWESTILPARITGYRPSVLDKLLARGTFTWKFTENNGLIFENSQNINWDAMPHYTNFELSGKESAICNTLKKRGASFLHALNSAEPDTLTDTMQNLIKMGLVCSDSFEPVRFILNADKIKPQRKKNARLTAFSAGRWDLVRTRQSPTTELILQRELKQAGILARETCSAITWSTALETLRVWEFTGKVRRGYFVKGLSGAQFVLSEDFEAIQYSLNNPRGEIVWLHATDPNQVWGKALKHSPSQAFTSNAGTVLALKEGKPIAIFERNGQQLRFFDESVTTNAIAEFVKAFEQKRLYTSLKRITLKKYPENCKAELEHAGFIPQMQDLVLYRSNI